MLIRDPMYQQLHTILRGRLQNGQFPPGGRFLTERQLAAEFQVSRATANKVLSSLVSEGSLEFRKGLGTFVTARRWEFDLRTLISFTHQASAQGLTPRTRVLEFRELRGSAIPPELRKSLELGDQETVLEMMRLRSAGREPLILERRWVVAKHCPGLNRKLAGGSLYAVWQEQFGLVIATAEERVRAVMLSVADAGQLGVPAGSAALEVECLGRLDSGVPLWWEQTRYRGDAYEFRQQLTASSGQSVIARRGHSRLESAEAEQSLQHGEPAPASKRRQRTHTPAEKMPAASAGRSGRKSGPRSSARRPRQSGGDA